MRERSPATPDEVAVLASPLRLQILRVCLHEPHTNREIAAALGLNPATCLHHVRRLVDTDFLAVQPPRRGRRGSREVPYLATRRSWNLDQPGVSRVLLDTFLADIERVEAAELSTSRLGLRLPDRDREEFVQRLFALLEEYADRPSDPDGEPWSVFLALHPDRSVPAADTRDPERDDPGAEAKA